MTQNIKTRILIISDTHNRPLQNAEDPTRPFREPLPTADVLIHCGDLTMEGSLRDYNATLDAIKHVEAPLKLVIAGNHDLTLDEEWMDAHKGDWRVRGMLPEQRDVKAIRNFWTGVDGRAKKEGVTFLDEGLHSFTLANGARLKVYASPYTPDFWDWGYAYAHHEDRFNPSASSFTDAKNIASNPIPSFEDERIDVMITHGPPLKRLDLTRSGTFAGCPHLLRALMRSRPLVHCFGHIHEGWGAEVVKWAPEAKDVAVRAAKQDAWRKGGEWKEGVQGSGGIVTVPTDGWKQSAERCLHVDATEGGEQGFVRGEKTVLANAAIVDINYAAVNAPILVDVELQKQE